MSEGARSEDAEASAATTAADAHGLVASSAGAGDAAALAREEVARGVYRLPLAIPFEVGPVNAYLVLRGERPLLIDCGARTRAAWAALEAHLAALDLRPADLADAVATHAHVDHHGNLGHLVRARPDLRVHCHEDDADAIAFYHASLERSTASAREAMRFWGLPREALASVERFRASFGRFGEDIDPARLVRLRGAEAPLDLPGLALRARHCPGHCEGLIVLVLEPERPGDERLLFSSDHVLERITPNPALYHPTYRGRRTGLGDYLTSLEGLRGLPVERILPGHGPAFSGLDRRIDEILVHHRDRAARIQARLAEAPRTIFGLVGCLWPGLGEDQHYLACREVHGHLDLLALRGHARLLHDGADGAVFGPA